MYIIIFYNLNSYNFCGLWKNLHSMLVPRPEEFMLNISVIIPFFNGGF